MSSGDSLGPATANLELQTRAAKWLPASWARWLSRVVGWVKGLFRFLGRVIWSHLPLPVVRGLERFRDAVGACVGVCQEKVRALPAPWVERLARLGYATKGVIYILVGALSARTAVGAARAPEGSEGVLIELASQRFGTFLLFGIAIGLSGYVLWRCYQALADAERKGSDLKGMAQRLGYLVSGVTYGSLAYTAVQIILRVFDTDGDAPQDWTRRLFQLSFGTWLVGLVGLIIIGVGLEELYRAFSGRFEKDMKRWEMGEQSERWMRWFGRFGIAARGLVWGLIGLFLVQAAVRYDPARAEGLGGALEVLAHQPYGPWMLGVASLGLIAFGLFALMEARYRRINAE